LIAAAALVLTAGSDRSTAATDRNCSDFPTQAAAQHYFNAHGGSATNDFDNLDGDGDGRACESLPCPCAGPGGGGGGEETPTVPSGSRLRAKVVEAVDGDTLKVDLHRGGAEIDVRLIGIDTPETRRPGTPIECGGPQASRLMHRMADGRGVILVTDPSQDRFDRYGRLLAYAIRGDGLDLNRAEVRRGWAEVYVYNGNPFRRVGDYRRAQRRARTENLGVWRRCGGDFHSAS
jgi:endonuclease YncB( thermonuclease family)